MKLYGIKPDELNEPENYKEFKNGINRGHYTNDRFSIDERINQFSRYLDNTLKVVRKYPGHISIRASCYYLGRLTFYQRLKESTNETTN